jgi:hypothetical protein
MEDPFYSDPSSPPSLTSLSFMTVWNASARLDGWEWATLALLAATVISVFV